MRFPWHPSVGIHQRLQLLNGLLPPFLALLARCSAVPARWCAAPPQTAASFAQRRIVRRLWDLRRYFCGAQSMGKNGKRCKHVQTWSCFRHFTIEHDRICQQSPRMGRLEALATWGSQQRIFLQRWSQIDICNRWNDRSGLSNLM